MDRGRFVYFFKDVGLGVLRSLLLDQRGGSVRRWAVFLTRTDPFQLKSDNSPKPSQKKSKGRFQSRGVICLEKAPERQTVSTGC